MNSEDRTALASLKDFQRDTVDYAFARMYEDPNPALRFLIADEVGLGKTKVAAGIVARAVDRLREEDPGRRVDVIYICSNSGIARQNINRLNVTGQPSHDCPIASRCCRETSSAFARTTSTSSPSRRGRRSTCDRAVERRRNGRLLYWLLPDDWMANKKGSLSLLTGGMRRDRFKGRVDELEGNGFDEPLQTAFRKRLDEEPNGPGGPGGSLRDRFIALADSTRRPRAFDGRGETAAAGNSRRACGAFWPACASSRSSRIS